MFKPKKNQYNIGFNQGIKEAIKVISDKILSHMCPNSDDGFPLVFSLDNEIITAFGHKGEPEREMLYPILHEIYRMQKI